MTTYFPVSHSDYDRLKRENDLIEREENMKMVRRVEEEVDVKTVRVEVAVRYEEEDIPNDFPLRDGDMWRADIDIESGKIKDWPAGKSGHLSMKVCDHGTYTLFDANGSELAKIDQDYIPNDLIPGEYGDYIDLQIDENGIVTNWPKNPNLIAFSER